MGIPLTATHAAGGAATITIAALDSAAGDQTISSMAYIEIEMLAWSYSAAPTNGALTITSNGVTIFQMDITSAGPGFIPFSGSCLKGSPGQNLVITLADGGVTQKLNVIQRL